MKRGCPKTPQAVKALSRDMLNRIRKAEWVEDRKEKKRAELRTVPRPTFGASWGQIIKVMR